MFRGKGAFIGTCY